MIEENEIPKTWERTPLETFLNYIQPSKYIVESTDYHDSYKTPVLTAGKSFLLGYTNEIEGIFDQLPTIIFDDFTTAIKFVNFPFKVKSSAMKILVPTSNLVNIRYVYYFMETLSLNVDTHKRYWISVGAKVPIPVPPHTEQQRIVAKIEELFSELDKGIETLKKAQQQLKVYRQAVLKYAFEGKLTCSDLKENEFPVGWVIKRISDVVIKSTLKSYPDKESDLKFLGMDSIEPNSTKPHFFYKFSDMKSAGNLFISNQVLYGRMRPYLNKVWVADCDGAASGEFIVMTCKELILPLYLLNILHHQDFVKFANSKTSGDRPRISFDEISEFEILIPPITEQNEILNEIESRLSVCDKIEESIEQGLQQAEALRQSILKKAFEGKLVPQNPNDEPASVLLERIKAERQKAQPEKKTKPKKVKA